MNSKFYFHINGKTGGAEKQINYLVEKLNQNNEYLCEIIDHKNKKNKFLQNIFFFILTHCQSYHVIIYPSDIIKIIPLIFLFNKKIIFDIRSEKFTFSKNIKNLLIEFLLRLILPYMKNIISNNNSVFNHYKYMKSLKKIIYPNFLDSRYFISELKPPQKNYINIGWIGNDRPEKNLLRFIQIINILHNYINTKNLFLFNNLIEKINIHLYVKTGDISFTKNKIDKLNKTIGLEKFINLDVLPIYSNLDLVISTSTTEGLSNILLECITSKTPVFFPNVGDTALYLNKKYIYNKNLNLESIVNNLINSYYNFDFGLWNVDCSKQHESINHNSKNKILYFKKI